MNIENIYNNISYYVKHIIEYLELNIYPKILDILLYLYNTISSNRSLFLFIVLLLIYLYIKSKRPKVLKSKKYKSLKNKKFYNTGFRLEFCFYDIIKFKLRLCDYCDKKGIRYYYLFNIKLFFIEFLRLKYIDQKGQVYKRKITFRG